MGQESSLKPVKFAWTMTIECMVARRDAVEAGEPVEGAFSRNRSFRKKFKRYGKYVPRGQTLDLPGSAN